MVVTSVVAQCGWSCRHGKGTFSLFLLWNKQQQNDLMTHWNCQPLIQWVWPCICVRWILLHMFYFTEKIHKNISKRAKLFPFSLALHTAQKMDADWLICQDYSSARYPTAVLSWMKPEGISEAPVRQNCNERCCFKGLFRVHYMTWVLTALNIPA